MNSSKRSDAPPPEGTPPAEGRVQLASGWWGWFRSDDRPPKIGPPTDPWLVFWHEVHRHWRIRVQIHRSWRGSPAPATLATEAMTLTVDDDLGSESQVFVLRDHIFVQRGKLDIGVLLPHDGRPLAELSEQEIKEILNR